MINPDDFEAGENVTDQFNATPRSRMGTVISARFNMDEAAAIIDAAEREHMTVSAYVRMCALKHSGDVAVWLRYEPGMTVSYTR